MTVWFITGASRGLGLELARLALDGGDHVIAAARRPELVRDALDQTSDHLECVHLDVTDARQAFDGVRTGVERFGRIDVLVNNAGYGLFGAVEEASDSDVRTLFDTNVFGLLNVTRAALPVMRAQRAGRVLNIGSSAGLMVGAGRGLYGASKFAVEAISEALREELAPLGIHVTVVEPGSFRTGFLTAGSARRPAATMDAYTDTVGALQSAIDANDGHQPGDPRKAAKVIRELAACDAPPPRLALGTDAVELVEAKIATLTEGLKHWRRVSLSTDYSVV